MTQNNKQILALIPAYNEATRIVPVIEATAVSLPVLVVDDGSKDDTAVVAAKAGAAVHIQIPNQGKGQALKAGFSWAIDNGYHAVLTLDADGQHDPNEIPTFLDKYAQTDADLIIGARDFRQMPKIRRLANWLGSRILSWAMRHRVEDNQSGYRLISQRLMTAMLESKEGGFEFEVEMIVTCVKLDYTLEWVPIRTIYGEEPSNINPIQHFTNFLRIVAQTRRRMRQ